MRGKVMGSGLEAEKSKVLLVSISQKLYPESKLTVFLSLSRTGLEDTVLSQRTSP